MSLHSIFSGKISPMNRIHLFTRLLPAAAFVAAMPLHAETGPGALPQNLTAWGMFLGADWVVKAVMIGLGIASIVTWTVLVDRQKPRTAQIGGDPSRRARRHQRSTYAA